MRLQYTDRFQRVYDALTDEDARHIEEAIRLLAADPRHPSLHVKRVQGTKGIWEARASRSLRITFETDGELIILRNAGAHDKTLRNP